MTRDEAEQKVQARWGVTCQATTGCAMRVDRALTEVYCWGSVVSLVPEDNAESPPARPSVVRRYRYACDRQSGYTDVVGSKGLTDTLRRLEILPKRGFGGRTDHEWNELVAELTRPIDGADAA